MPFSYANSFHKQLSQIISNTNQCALSCQSFPKFKSFHNYSNILEIEREFENKPNRCFDSNLWNLNFKAGLPPRQPLFNYNDNHILVSYSRSSLVRVDVYPILLHLKNFLGVHEPYFAHAFFNNIIAL